MTGSPQLVWLFAAFWTAVLGFTRDRHSRGFELRFLAGLATGAWLTHVGWALLYLDRLGGDTPLLPRASGFCVLFFPLGPLLLAPRAQAAAREAYLASSFAALPVALAVARLGCLVTGCCLGLPLHAPTGWPARHPTWLYEVAGLLALDGCTRRLGRRWRAPAVLAGMGLLRLAVEPMRAPAPLGEPLVPVELLAASWIAVAVGLACRRRPTSRTSPGAGGAPAPRAHRGSCDGPDGGGDWPSRMALRPPHAGASGPSGRGRKAPPRAAASNAARTPG